MQLIRGLKNLQSSSKGSAVTIGNFDGVHRGHQFIITNLAEQARNLGLPITLILFEPQPLEYFLMGNAPSRLTRLREKLIWLAELPVDFILLLKFDQYLANLQPEEFIRQILVSGLAAKYLIVGDDFRFGKDRMGDIALLKSIGPKNGFIVENTQSFHIDQERVSSTLIRKSIESGDFDRAKQFLGRRYSVLGRVVEGDRRGRSIGFPTANILMFRKNTPVKGVFAVTMSGIGNRSITGVANVGTRPTVDGETVLLEAHLFDFSADIYRRCVEIHFWKKIRDETRFDSLEQLKNQIQHDVAVAKDFFTKLNQHV